jgi:hypothetical protein
VAFSPVVLLLNFTLEKKTVAESQKDWDNSRHTFITIGSANPDKKKELDDSRHSQQLNAEAGVGSA